MVIWITFACSGSILVNLFLKHLGHSCHLLFDHFQLTLIHGPTIPGSYKIVLLQIQIFLRSPVTFTTGHCFCFGPASSLFLELFLHFSPVAYGHLLTWGVHLSVSYLFAFSYCSWGSQGKNTEVVCHSLLQWGTFCQNSPPWPICIGWPYMAWLSFIEKLWAKRKWHLFQALKGKQFNQKLYLGTLSFRNEKKIKTFSDDESKKNLLISRPTL